VLTGRDRALVDALPAFFYFNNHNKEWIMVNKRKMRGVIVYDIELTGGIGQAVAFDVLLREHCKNLQKLMDEKYPEMSEAIKIEQSQSAIPLQERRGKTGPLEKIIFKGSRGSYKKRSKKKGPPEGDPVS
jgi:hypothetical protein